VVRESELLQGNSISNHPRNAQVLDVLERADHRPTPQSNSYTAILHVVFLLVVFLLVCDYIEYVVDHIRFFKVPAQKVRRMRLRKSYKIQRHGAFRVFHQALATDRERAASHRAYDASYL
jgi:hypothetical protein